MHQNFQAQINFGTNIAGQQHQNDHYREIFWSLPAAPTYAVLGLLLNYIKQR